jgi:hypothetical protein
MKIIYIKKRMSGINSIYILKTIYIQNIIEGVKMQSISFCELFTVSKMEQKHIENIQYNYK